MSYTCKGKDGNTYNLQLLYIQRAYLPAITVCNQSLFKQTFVPNPPLPSVTNFVLESNGLVTSFSWTPNATYFTYSEYKIDSGEWIYLDDYPVNWDHSFFNFTGIATIGQSIYIRLRFGNGANYGAWNEEYTVTTPFVLFYGNTLPDLVYITNGFIGQDPIASLSDNNVVIDHPEYLTGFIGQMSYDGQFDFTACSNITLINIDSGVNNGAKIYGCGNLNSFTLSQVDPSYIENTDFTGCISLYYLSLQNCNITNLDLLDTIPNELLLGAVNLSDNDITTADLTNFINLEALDIGINVNLSSLLVNSVSLRDIEAYNNTALTSLDLSSSLTYNVIALSSSNISTLTIANGTTNDGTTKTYYNLSDNNLSTESLNAFFTALGEAILFKKKKAAPTIYVDSNPGAEFCDPTIATAKGWSVYTGF